jgi:hypothetical protein
VGKDSRNRKNDKEKMKKDEVVAARADGSVIMQWQRGGVISTFSDLVVASRTIGLVLCHET